MQPRDLSDHAEYVPGRGDEEVARELGLDPDEIVGLASNENPHGPSPAAVEAARSAADEVDAYPKAAHADLTERLAEEWGVDPEQVWVSPGADGAIDYLSRAALDPGDAVLAPEPGFAYYPMSARYHHGAVRGYELSEADDFRMDADTVLDAYDGERLVAVTAPHNPTGATMDAAELDRLLDAVDDHTLVVVDEAYGEYDDAPSTIERLADDGGPDNLAVLRTFSKAYGLAGLRVGYAVVPAAWGDAYAKVNTPFAVNEVGLRAALAALDDRDHVDQTVESAARARERLESELSVPTYESAGNFVLAAVGDGSAVAEAAEGRGVLIRDCTSFGLPDCVRISCGTEAETDRAIEVLNDVVATLRTEP